jgi:hypothetical protein
MKALEFWLGEGKESWDESMKDHEEFSISKAQFYKTKKQTKQKVKLKVTDYPFA